MNSAVPLSQNEPGFINCLVHNLTGAQVLFYLFHAWKDDPNRAVILWCEKGEALKKMNSIRVALSKERKARGLLRTFELRFSFPWPYTHNGIKGEAIKVEQVGGTLLTQMRAAFTELNRGQINGK